MVKVKVNGLGKIFRSMNEIFYLFVCQVDKVKFRTSGGTLPPIQDEWKNEKGTRESAYLRQAMPDPREHIGPNTFLKYRAKQYYIVFGPISGEESLFKKSNNSRFRIRSWIFSKIESIHRGCTPNLSTKFRTNTSTTFWDIMLYIGLARSLNGEESL